MSIGLQAGYIPGHTLRPESFENRETTGWISTDRGQIFITGFVSLSTLAGIRNSIGGKPCSSMEERGIP